MEDEILISRIMRHHALTRFFSAFEYPLRVSAAEVNLMGVRRLASIEYKSRPFSSHPPLPLES